MKTRLVGFDVPVYGGSHRSIIKPLIDGAQERRLTDGTTLRQDDGCLTHSDLWVGAKFARPTLREKLQARLSDDKRRTPVGIWGVIYRYLCNLDRADKDAADKAAREAAARNPRLHVDWS